MLGILDYNDAPVMELVDMPDSKSGVVRRIGSNPIWSTVTHGSIAQLVRAVRS